MPPRLNRLSVWYSLRENQFVSLPQVLVGAHALLANGGIIAPAGTALVALAAKKHAVSANGIPPSAADGVLVQHRYACLIVSGMLMSRRDGPCQDGATLGVLLLSH